MVWTRSIRDIVTESHVGNYPSLPCCSLWFCVAEIASSSYKLIYIAHQIHPECSQMMYEREWYFYGCLSLQMAPWTQVLVAITWISNFWVLFFGVTLDLILVDNELPTKIYLEQQCPSFWQSSLGSIKRLERVQQLSRPSHALSFRPQRPTHQQECARSGRR